MKKNLNNWERMEAVIRWANMSTNYFARYIGLARGENLYQIKRGNNDRHVPIPYYKADPETDITRIAELRPDDYLFLPMVGACDFAMRYNGRAMGDVIPAGTIVLLRNVEPDAIIPGGEYVIVSEKIVTLRIVRSVDDEERFRLVAGDREHYDDMLLAKSSVQKAYKVKVKLIIND